MEGAPFTLKVCLLNTDREVMETLLYGCVTGTLGHCTLLSSERHTITASSYGSLALASSADNAPTTSYRTSKGSREGTM